MTSHLLRKILVAGTAVAHLSALRQREPGTGGVKQSVGGSEPILKRIDPG